MDPLSITTSILTILQLTGKGSGLALGALKSLWEAPEIFKQLITDAEILRGLLLDTEACLRSRHRDSHEDPIPPSIVHVLKAIKERVTEFELLVQWVVTSNRVAISARTNGLFECISTRLSCRQTEDGNVVTKVKRARMLRSEADIQRIKMNIRDSCDILRTQLDLLQLDNKELLTTTVLQIQSVTVASHDAICALQEQQHKTQKDMQIGFQSLNARQHNLLRSMQPLIEQAQSLSPGQISTSEPDLQVANSGVSANSPAVLICASVNSHRCPRGCRCRCHTRAAVRTPPWLRNVVGQLHWSFDSSISMRPCNYAPCRRSLSKHNITCYFPPWLVSRAIMASVNLENVFDAGAKVSVNVPLIVPEEDHIVWPLVMAGNLGQLRELLSKDRNLMYVRNQWGQSIMHVAAKIHQPAVFNLLKNEGMDQNLADENQKSAAITVLTRRGSQEYNLPVDTEDLADRLGWTNLHKVAALGARHGQEITEALLRESEYSDINTKDILGRTPLHWLAENGKSDATRLITQDPWSADVQARDLCGFTALHCACWADDFDSIVALLDVGIDVNALDKHMRTPMMHMSSPEILKYLLRKGADVHISDDEAANIMHHACVSDQEDLVEILLREYSHFLLTRNHTGDTPLGQAIANNSLAVLKVMAPYLQGFPELQSPVPNESLMQPERLSLLNNNKRSLLHLTALHGSTEAMDILASANLCGVDTAIRDKDGHTPNECFVRCRDNHCAVTRKPFESEKLAWVSLMNSARGQELPFQGLTGQDADDESTIVASEDEWGHRKISTASYVFIDPSGGEVSSDDEFVDAEDEVRE
ncbi:B-cell lymphoma 3-encoded protein [Colletotrichum abscissum]|uniref:B-cell lymphoma 3-encoded protein n=1 Tax=Colletotrichum abscissum TaxID=1671311 RepID=UPI0027D48089|nr:B-cell lymphoma 3-encoded protein [Colletotrichum abscissum]KAK1488495.1 B-cell lymphoma 3-encoded protein [Colletotrichum abscissum]